MHAFKSLNNRGMKEKRIRILIIAYACEPNRGSEPGTAWNIAIRLSQTCDVTVVTRANNQEVIENEVGKADNTSLSFLYIDPASLFLKMKKAHILPVQAFYAFWQMSVAKVLWKDHLMDQFDIIHQMTFNSFEIPPSAFLKRSKAQLIWGPIGGGQTVPLNQLSLFGAKGGFLELIRNLRVYISAFNPLCIKALRNSKLVYFANYETCDLLRRWCKADVDMMIDVGVDVNKFKPRDENSDQDRKPIILFGGRLEGRKGAILLLKALFLLKVEGAVFECRIIGSGPDEVFLKSWIDEQAMGAEVKMLGLVSHAQMAQEFGEADVFVFPSLRDTSGAIVMEAMATSLPTVCLNHQGGGIMVDDSCGIKIKSESVDAMAHSLSQAMRRLLSDSELRVSMGKAARERVCQEYDWDVRVEKVLKGYRKVLGCL